MIDQWLHTYVLYITRLGFSPTVVFGAKTPTTTAGDTQDPSHSVLLPSESIKRLSQHSVAIQATPTLFAFRRGKGSTGGGRGGWGSIDVFCIAYLVVPCIFFFYTRNHVYVWTWRNTGHLYMYIYIHIHTHIHIHIHIHVYINTCAWCCNNLLEFLGVLYCQIFTRNNQNMAEK